MLQGETSHEKDSQCGLRVADHSVPDQFEDLRERLGRHLDELVRLPRVLARREIGCPKKGNAFVCETGGRPYGSKTLEPTGFHTDFFQQLPLSTYPRILARVQSAGRDLDECPIGRIPVLLNEEDSGIGSMGIGSEGNDGRRSWMPDHLELSRRLIGKPHGIDVQIDHSTRIDALALELHTAPVIAETAT